MPCLWPTYGLELKNENRSVFWCRLMRQQGTNAQFPTKKTANTLGDYGFLSFF